MIKNGYCGYTEGNSGNCSKDIRGSVSFTHLKLLKSCIGQSKHACWNRAEKLCTTFCMHCGNCHFISFSPVHNDCSWFSYCSKLKDHIKEFKTIFL